MAHDCPACYQACYCDGDDTYIWAPNAIPPQHYRSAHAREDAEDEKNDWELSDLRGDEDD